MNITREDFDFISTDGKTKITGAIYKPENPKKVIQIAHGMAEHIARYDAFARYMTEQGCCVVIYNHAGHKDSVASDDDLGFIADENGDRILIDDTIKVFNLTKEKYPELPFILMGHSMGSFIVRNAAAEISDSLSGLIISGTGGPNGLIGIGIKMTKAEIKKNGPRAYSAAVQKMAFGSYNKKFEGRTEYDWLSRDTAIVDKYVADKYCGFEFTVSAMKDLMTLIKNANSKSAFSLNNKELPILLYSGSLDPVGSFGKGPKKVCDNYINAGMKNVTLKLFEGGRHEMLNELNKDEVFSYVSTWAEAIK